MQWVLEEQDPGRIQEVDPGWQWVTHPLRLGWLVSEPWTSPQVEAGPNRDAGDRAGWGRTGPGQQDRKHCSSAGIRSLTCSSHWCGLLKLWSF